MENESSSGRGNGNVCSWIGYHGNLQSQGQSLLIPSTFNLGDPDPSVPCLFSPPPPSMQAMKKSSAADVFAFPSQAKKRNHWRGRSALKSPELLTTNGCKRLQGLRLQHTNDCMHADGPRSRSRPQGKGEEGLRYFRYSMASMAGMQ